AAPLATAGSAVVSTVRGARRVLPRHRESGWIDTPEPPSGLEQPVVVGATAGAAPHVDRGARERAGGIRTGQLELDVGVEDVLAGRTARVALRRAQQLVEAAPGIDHATTSSSSTPCPAAASRLRSVRLASNRFL